MDSQFFDTQNAGDPVLLQHFFWFLGHPEVWLTLVAWAVLLLGAVKLWRRLKSARKTGWLAALTLSLIALLGCHIWLSFHAMTAFAQGLGEPLVALGYVQWITFLLALFSAGWIVYDWITSRFQR